MINGQKEIWVKTGNKANSNKTIIAISNCGRIMRKNGIIEFSFLTQKVYYNNQQCLIHRALADYFIPKTEEDIMKQRNVIDHITHNPIGMNVNDIRNLRWCTIAENNSFEEFKENLSKAMKGRKLSEEHKNKLSIVQLNKPKKSKTGFGFKYIEHYGYGKAADEKQYHREKQYFYTHGKCRWE